MGEILPWAIPAGPVFGAMKKLRLSDLVWGVAGLAAGAGLVAVLSAPRPIKVPGMHLALFPPTWKSERILGAIVAGGAKPVADTMAPGAWVVHLNPDQEAKLPGALLTDAGPVLGLAGACVGSRQVQ